MPCPKAPPTVASKGPEEAVFKISEVVDRNFHRVMTVYKGAGKDHIKLRVLMRAMVCEGYDQGYIDCDTFNRRREVHDDISGD